MFVCSRCGSSYNERHIGVEHCPRCRLRDKVESPLAFKAFDLSGIETGGLGTPDQVDGSGTDSRTNASTATPSSIT
jgi:hypothetical protein